MADRRVEPDAEVLPAKVAERVLKRASELDAAHATGTAVAELRAAAAEAGISAHAFEAALGELQEVDQEPAPASTRRWRGLFIGLAALGAVVLAAAMIVIPARLAPRATPGMAEHTILLNCAPADQVIERIRPLLTDPNNSIVRPGNTASTIIVRVTPEQMQKVQGVIDQVDNPQACVRR